MESIRIRGARTHNLKSISLEIPRDKLVVITGLSGSGKSSLAFDTLYAEGQRRYVESLSAYARQFLSVMQKPDVESIEGLSPAISIEQKSTSHNPRSTVGTVTEIYDYLRLLFARVGQARCPEHDVDLLAQNVSQMVDQVMELPPESAWLLLAPVVRGRKGEHADWFDRMRAQGFVRVRIDSRLYELDDVPVLDRRIKHDIDIVVDRFKVRPELKQRLSESFETALRLTDGLAVVVPYQDHVERVLTFSSRMACPYCGYALEELEPRLFSFNAPHGACPTCDGLGQLQAFDPERVVGHPDASLAEGAIRGWDRRNPYYWGLISSTAKHYGFSTEIAFQDLPEHVQAIVLYGSGDEKVDFEFVGEPAQANNRRAYPFEGVIPVLERRYRETESAVVREELARYLTDRPCPDCDGDRLNVPARHVFVGGCSLPALARLSVREASAFFDAVNLPGNKGEIAKRIIGEIVTRLRFLDRVGLDYLTLSRSAETLSGGEAQRIRLASQIGAGLVGVMYVLDEPSIGLHQRDNKRLLETLRDLRDLGNTVIVVEHDEDAIRAADHVIDMGPGAGIHGGAIVAQGTPTQVESTDGSLTGAYLSGRMTIDVPSRRRRADAKKRIIIRGARGNNLKSIDVAIPVGLFSCVTGVSGSGKSTLINDTLLGIAARELNGAGRSHAAVDRVEGLEHLDKVIDINQSPIGRTPRSNPATYTGLFTLIRELFAQVTQARERGYGPGRFSFNVKGGRCETCEGDGVIKVEMHFLPDIYVLCDACRGRRYNRETLEIKYKHKSIDQVLDMTIEEAHLFFRAIPAIRRKLETLLDVGLSYVKLGQNATTLSGGEAQRVKLAKELSRRNTGRTLYILDEPTTGLHFHDVSQLLTVLERLRDAGNTVVVIEHNLDVVKRADWLIDLGPEGGEGGGEVVATGTPEDVALVGDSHTGLFLKRLLQRSAPDAKSRRQA